MKKAWVKVREDSGYDELAPNTYADMVYLDDSHVGTLMSKLNDLEQRLATLEAREGDAPNAYEPVKLVISATEPPLEENTLWVLPGV